MKPMQLKNAAIQELSLVFRHDENGVEFAPRNSEARMLSVKSAEKGMASKALDVLKSYFLGDQGELQMPAEYPVTEAADNVDGGDDGASDYNEIVRAICSLYSDIGAACALSDDGARSAAIVSCIDTFLLGLDALRCCDDESGKAGARHSAADIATLHQAYDAIDQIGKHQAALMGHLESLGITGAESSDDGKIGKDEDDGPNSSRENDGDKAAEVKAEEIVIIPDAKEGFEEADKSAEQEPEMTAEQIAALVAEGVAKALAASKTESDSVIAAVKAEAEAAKAQAVKAQALADAAEAKAAEDREILKALSGVSSSHTPLSAAVAAQKSGGLADRMAREMKNNPQSTRI